MGITKKYQRGFSVVELVVIVVVLGLVGFVAWRIFGANSEPTPGDQAGSGSFVEWSFNDSAWQPSGSAPSCEEPLAIASPIDATLATSVLLPGQMRGADFKPHGGIGIDDAADNKVDVSAIRDAYLYRGSRYIESGAVQYMFDFMDSCGVMYRLDHLAKLTDEFMQYAELLPQPAVDDSRTHNFNDHVFIKKGTAIATEVGYVGNTFFDVGVYDLRKPNAASKTAAYQTDNLRISDKEQSFFAVCWFDLLQGEEKTLIKALPPRGGDKESASDYCE